MPRFEQTIAYSITPVVPTTANKLPVFTTTGNPAKASDSLFAQSADAHSILIGSGAAVNAGQVANKPVYLLGEGASAWGDSAIAIGTNAQAGQTAAKDGAIAIGSGTVVNGKNTVRIGSQLAFGAAAGDDVVILGTQAACNGNAGIAIGRGAIGTTNAIAIGHTASTNGTTEGIAIGHSATAANVGVNHFGIAIGVSAVAGTNTNESAIAIGHNATASNALASKLIVIGDGATITANITNAIAIGAAATSSRSNECVIGDNAQPITMLSLRAGAGVMAGIRGGSTSGVGIRNLADTATLFQVDESSTAGDTRMLVWDVTKGALVRVLVGAADSGGVGFKMLRVVN